MNIEALAVYKLSQAGYSPHTIQAGLAYAEKQGYSSVKELMSLALSRILYSDTQLTNGERFEWSDNGPN